MPLGPAERDAHVLTFDIVAGLLHAQPKCRHVRSRFARRPAAEEPDHWHRRPLRSRRERPGGGAAEQRDELAALHSITSSATSSRSRGISRLSDLAVLRLITSSYLVGCSTGRSPGFAPFKILPT